MSKSASVSDSGSNATGAADSGSGTSKSQLSLALGRLPSSGPEAEAWVETFLQTADPTKSFHVIPDQVMALLQDATREPMLKMFLDESGPVSALMLRNNKILVAKTFLEDPNA